MNLTSKNRWYLSVCVVFVVLLVLTVDGFLSATFQRPKDAELIAQFTKHKAVFEELRQMLITDTNLHSVQGWGVSSAKQTLGSSSLSEAGISKERYELYMAKLQTCGVSNLIHDEDEFRFVVAASGFASKGYRIAITYTELQPKPLLPTLEDFKKNTHSWEQAYRHIEGNWYLWIIW